MSVPPGHPSPQRQPPDGYTRWGSFAQPGPHAERGRWLDGPSEPAPPRARRRLRAGLLAALVIALAAVLGGLLGPRWFGAGVTSATSDGTTNPHPTAGRGAIASAPALAASLVAAIDQHDQAAVEQLICPGGAAARAAVAQLAADPATQVVTHRVDATGRRAGVVALTTATSGHRVRYRGLITIVDGSWCVSTLQPAS